MIVLATIPVGLVGLVAEHPFRVLFGKPIVAGVFLAVNGVILIAGERFRRPDSLEADERIAAGREAELVMAGGRAAAQPPTPGPAHARPRAASTGGTGQSEEAAAVASDRRLSTMGYGRAIVIGSAQILALFAGISRDGVTMVTGMRRGLSREDAVRFAFLLSTPVIFAAGVLKIPDLFGPLGQGIGGPILLGSILSFIGAYAAIRFLVRYLRTNTLYPFGIYCLIAGPGQRGLPRPDQVRRSPCSNSSRTTATWPSSCSMLAESACIPVPSELIMTFGGALAAGAVPGTHLNLIGVILAGTAGNVAGSYIAWAVGRYGAEPALRRWGKRIGIREHDIDRGIAWFDRHGNKAVLIGRVLPVVRTFISLPAGIAEMPALRFGIYTTIGCIPWTTALAVAGYAVGKNWESIVNAFHGPTYIIAAVVLVALVDPGLALRPEPPTR